MAIDLLPNIPNAPGLIYPGNAPYTPGPAGDVSYVNTPENKTVVLPYGQLDQAQVQSFMANHPEHLGVFDNYKNAVDYVNNMDVRSVQPAGGYRVGPVGGGVNYLSPQQSWDKMEKNMGGSPQANWSNMMTNIGQGDHTDPQQATNVPKEIVEGTALGTPPQTEEGV